MQRRNRAMFTDSVRAKPQSFERQQRFGGRLPPIAADPAKSLMIPAIRIPKGRRLVGDYSLVRSVYNRYFGLFST